MPNFGWIVNCQSGGLHSIWTHINFSKVAQLDFLSFHQFDAKQPKYQIPNTPSKISNTKLQATNLQTKMFSQDGFLFHLTKFVHFPVYCEIFWHTLCITSPPSTCFPSWFSCIEPHPKLWEHLGTAAASPITPFLFENRRKLENNRQIVVPFVDLNCTVPCYLSINFEQGNGSYHSTLRSKLEG